MPRQVTPARGTYNAHGDHRKLRDLHSLELRIPRAQKRLRLIVFAPVDQDFGMTSQHDPTELSPILLITIDNNGNRWILSDILQPLEWGLRLRLGFASIVT